MPRVLAHENRCAAPRSIERAHLVPSFYESLLVEQPIRRQEVLPMDMKDLRLGGAEAHVECAVVQCVAPFLVEPEHHIYRRSRGQCIPVRVLKIARELPGGDRQVPNCSFDEVPSCGRLWKLDDGG